MPFKPGREPVSPDFKRLIGTLHHSDIKTRDNALYQVIKSLIDWSSQQVQVTNSQVAGLGEQISSIEAGSGGGNGNGGTTPPPVMSVYDSPLTDGDSDETELIFADGDCIIVQVPV